MNSRFILNMVAALAGTAALVGGNITTAHAQSPSPSTNAWDYNLFTFSDASGSAYTDVQGKVAIGGNATFTGFALASTMGTGNTINAVIGGNYSNGANQFNGSMIVGGNANFAPSVHGALYVKGNVTLTDGSVDNGVQYGGSYSGPGYISHTAVAASSINTGIDFSAKKTEMTTLSASLNSMTTNGTVSWSSNTLNLTGTGAQNVYNISYADLVNASSGLNITASSGATVIINVTGGGGVNFSIPNTGRNVNGTTAEKVLYNFVDATAFSVNGEINGSILATKATVTGNSGDLNGSLIANQFVENGWELHSHLFTGSITNVSTPNPVPEPGVYVTLLSLAGTTGIGLVRGRRRSRATVA